MPSLFIFSGCRLRIPDGSSSISWAICQSKFSQIAGLALRAVVVDWKELSVMSKKPNPPGSESVVAEEILRTAKMALESERPQPSVRCVICGGDAAPTSTEEL